jgi:hypothetical protein
MRSFLTHALMVLALVLSESSISQAQGGGSNEAPEMGLLAQARGQHRRPPGKRPRQGKAHQGDRVRIQVLLVHATSGQVFMDPALQRWSRHLRHLRYDSFRLLEKHRAALLPDGAREFEILGDRQISVTLLSKNPKRARLRVQMFRRGQKLVDTTVTVNRNGTFIMAGPSHRGGILVMPITASY